MGKKLTINNVNEAASLVLTKAIEANQKGTFAVGGCIIENATGKLIVALNNNVLVPLQNGDVFTKDPTAHGERLLVSWYYENKNKLGLQTPEHYTVVTSLDPCVMCTGALLRAGFNIGIIAHDYYGGINYNSDFEFFALPSNLREQAKKYFTYYAVGESEMAPEQLRRRCQGTDTSIFAKDLLSLSNLRGCQTIFTESIASTREALKITNVPPDKLKDPANLPDEAPVKRAYRQKYSKAFNLKLKNCQLNEDLLKALEETAGSENSDAVAFIDCFGNLLLCSPTRQDISPIQTAFMEVSQSYAKIRWELMNDPKTQEQATKYLTAPIHGIFVFLYAPDPQDVLTFITLGAYGSTIEGHILKTLPLHFQYYYPPKNGTIEELITTISNLPPFYR